MTPAVPIEAVRSAMLGQRSDPPPASRAEPSGRRSRSAGENTTPPASGVVSVRPSELVEATPPQHEAQRRR
jgi:hypothetical protein